MNCMRRLLWDLTVAAGTPVMSLVPFGLYPWRLLLGFTLEGLFYIGLHTLAHWCLWGHIVHTNDIFLEYPKTNGLVHIQTAIGLMPLERYSATESGLRSRPRVRRTVTQSSRT